MPQPAPDKERIKKKIPKRKSTTLNCYKIYRSKRGPSIISLYPHYMQWARLRDSCGFRSNPMFAGFLLQLMEYCIRTHYEDLLGLQEQYKRDYVAIREFSESSLRDYFGKKKNKQPYDCSADAPCLTNLAQTASRSTETNLPIPQIENFLPSMSYPCAGGVKREESAANLETLRELAVTLSAGSSDSTNERLQEETNSSCKATLFEQIKVPSTYYHNDNKRLVIKEEMEDTDLDISSSSINPTPLVLQRCTSAAHETEDTTTQNEAKMNHEPSRISKKAHREARQRQCPHDSTLYTQRHHNDYEELEIETHAAHNEQSDDTFSSMSDDAGHFVMESDIMYSDDQTPAENDENWNYERLKKQKSVVKNNKKRGRGRPPKTKTTDFTQNVRRVKVEEEERMREVSDRFWDKRSPVRDTQCDSDSDGTIIVSEYNCKRDGCSFVCVEKEELKRHMRRDHYKRSSSSKGGPATCLYCNRTLRNMKGLKKHLNEVHCDMNLQTHLCELCGQGFKSTKKLKAHRNKVHNMLECKVCSLAFSTTNGLNRHINNMHLHVEDEKAVCEKCGMLFKSKASLESHEWTVHQDHAFPCSWEGCRQVCRSEKNLKLHMMIHTDEKPISCQFCDFRCRQSHSLKLHMKKHQVVTTEQGVVTLLPNLDEGVQRIRPKHPCQWQGCKKFFTTRFALRIHMRIHNDEKPFACQFCDYRCRQKISVQTHMKKHQIGRGLPICSDDNP